jgi:hypothetical protein
LNPIREGEKGRKKERVLLLQGEYLFRPFTKPGYLLVAALEFL